MRNLLLSLIACLIWIAASAATFADDAANTGQAVGVQPSADAQLQNVSRTLQVGSDVSIGDKVITGATGEVQLLFSEQTKLLIGANSSLLIENYLLRPEKNTASQVTMDALAGSFRFITGNSAKNAYRIDTPNGTIGVRGTKFDIHVSDQGTTVVLFEGAVRMCSLDDKCINVTATCGVGMTTPTGASMVARAQQAALIPFFPYVQSDATLLPDFRVVNAGDCLRPPPVVTPPSITPPRRTPRATTPRVNPPTTPPPRVVRRPPPQRVIDPCEMFDQLSRPEQLALIRRHICGRPPVEVQTPDLPPPSLANPVMNPRRYQRGNSGNSDGGVLY